MNFWERIRQRRWVRHIEWSLASLGTLIVFLIILVDWSGAQRWHEAKEKLAKEGLPLDLGALAPEPIPDAENFCAIPLLKDIALVIDGDEKKGEPGKKRARLKAASLPYWFSDKHRTLAGSAFGERADLKEWAAWMRDTASLPMPSDSGNPARDALAGLSRQEPLCQELAAGLDRTRAQWTPAWKTREQPRDPFMFGFPQIESTSGLHRWLALRGIAAVRAGDLAKAHESAQIMARLDEACLEEPHLHALLSAATLAPLLADVTWELCDAQAGTADDFTRLESALASMDFRRAACRATSNELVIGVDEVRFAMRSPEYAVAYLGPLAKFSFTVENVAIRCMPSGFYDANASVLVDRELEHFVKPIREGGWLAALTAARGMATELGKKKPSLFLHPSFIATSVNAAGIPAVISRSIYAQTVVNQAVIACALERHRIRNGRYPDSLTDLKLAQGNPLPLELLTGRPMSYRKTLNAKYALWSAGFDGKNHGGQRVMDKEKPARSAFYREDYPGDWVWDFPEK